MFVVLFFLISTVLDLHLMMFTDFRGTGWEGGRLGAGGREREREREREGEREIGRENESNIDVKEKHQLVGSRIHPDPGIEPTIYVCAVTRNRTLSLWYTRRCSSQLRHLAKAFLLFFSYLALYLRHSESKERTWRSDPHSILRSLAIRRAHRL